MNKFKYYIKYIEYFIKKNITVFTNDISFHAARLKKISGRDTDLLNPVTLNEKICHRLIFDHNPFYTILADKLAVRAYVEKNTNLVKLIPLLGIYNRVEDINLDNLPDKFVLKCNHDSGSTAICTNRAKFERA
ncbi:TPA: glycosyl transferase, partial [Escherichia coli]|nr:glycosyl transferase [Escherichia coli]